MELRHLRYFVAVAEHLNFTRAARELRVAQPALSRQVKQLEEEIGVALFERDKRHVSLTPSGVAFLKQATALLEQSEAAIRIAQNADARTTLNIGYVWGLFHTVAPQCVERFRAQHPITAINLLDLTSVQQADALTKGELDLGFIGFAYEADGARLEKAKVGQCDFVAVLPKKHPAARESAIDLAALQDELFLVISEKNYPGASRLIHDGCTAAGFRPRILQTPERGHTILAMVASNCGIALLPEPLKALPHSGVVFRRLKKPLRGELYVAWNPKVKSPSRDLFVRSIASRA